MRDEEYVVKFGVDQVNEMINKLIYQLYRESYKPDIIISTRAGIIPAAQLSNIIGCPVCIWEYTFSVDNIVTDTDISVLIFDLCHTEENSSFFEHVLKWNRIKSYNKKTSTLIESLDTKVMCDFASTYFQPDIFPVKFWWEHF